MLPPAPADAPGGQVVSALRILLPITAWLRDPALRQRQRLLVAAYALTPLILLIVIQRNADLVTSAGCTACTWRRYGRSSSGT